MTNKQTKPRMASMEDVEAEIGRIDLTHMPSSTTLPANELYLLHQMGYAPIQVVYGNIVYSMGMRGIFRSLRGAFQRGELPDFTRMNNDARVIARDRMLAAARAVNADMVVGVNIDVQELADLLEVTCTGTALRRAENPPNNNSVQIAVGA